MLTIVEDEIADIRIGFVTDHAAIYWPRAGDLGQRS